MITSEPPFEEGNCSHCGTPFEGGGIWQHFYAREIEKGATVEDAATEAGRVAECYGASPTKGRWGTRIAIYDMDRDCTVAHQCGNCGERRDRFTDALIIAGDPAKAMSNG